MRRLIPFLKTGDQAQQSVLEGGVVRRENRPGLKAILRGSLAIGVCAMITVGYIERTRLIDGIVTASADAGLELQTIEVKGRSHTPQSVILAASELTLGEPMLTISLPALHERLSTIGWIDEIAVERRMPSTIRIVLTERVPMALLQTEAGHRVIDRTGTVIAGADPSAFGHLTVVAGTSAAPNAGPILNILQTEPELFAEVWAVTYQSERRWDVHLRNGIRVRLPETDPRTAWSKLAIIDHGKQITNRDLAVIDMRVPDQMVVEPNIPVRGQGRNT
ncbi:MAG: cell division protein FtsQ/DivIB [Pseudomonadota bacterium]|nr:cell division protein FtsQ/DivIB [Pseudomonadota bacterium]